MVGVREHNAALRAARERLPSPRTPGGRMTRAELADAVNAQLWTATGVRYDLDDHLIGKWERGVVRWPIDAYRAALRAVLAAATDDELGFRPPARIGAPPSGPRPVAGPWSHGTIVSDAVHAMEHDVITRRDALRGAAVVGGAGLLAPLAGWLEPLGASGSGGSGSGAFGARRGAFAAAEVEAVERVVATFRGWRAAGSGLGRSAVVGQLSDVAERVRDAPAGPLTDRMLGAAAELAKISGSMAFDAGAHGAAQRDYVMAARLAKAGGNVSFGAVSLAALARQSFDLGNAGDGLEIVALAQRGSHGAATPALQAMLATRQAWGHAQRGEVYAFQRATDAAEHAHAEIHPGDEPRWLHGLDGAELAGVIGARYRDLARFDARHAPHAVTYIDRALAMRDPGRVRNRAFDLVSLARVHLFTGEHERGVAAVRSALPLIDAERPGRLARKVREWHREAAPFATVPTVRAARADVAATLPRTA